VWINWDVYSFGAVILGFPFLALGFGFLVAASSGLRIRIPGATLGATLAYSVYLTHKEVIHLDRLYLQPFIRLEGTVGFAVYVATILAVAGILYLCVERPFLQLRERIISPLRETTSVSKKAGISRIAAGANVR
jgi:peptidoglycan/LPS O-acetylase OafA/YrhL